MRIPFNEIRLQVESQGPGVPEIPLLPVESHQRSVNAQNAVFSERASWLTDVDLQGGGGLA